MTLGQAIEKDIKDTILVVPKQTLTEIGREYKEHIWKVSEEGDMPDGKPRQDLSTKYAQRKDNNSRNPFRDFIWTGAARKGFYFEEGQNTIGFGYDSGKVYNYMELHQKKAEGDIKDDTKKHRLYPIEKDSKTPKQKDVIQFAKDRILDVLNKPRTLKAKATVTRLG